MLSAKHIGSHGGFRQAVKCQDFRTEALPRTWRRWSGPRPLAVSYANKLLKIGRAPDPQKAIEDHREKDREEQVDRRKSARRRATIESKSSPKNSIIPSNPMPPKKTTVGKVDSARFRGPIVGPGRPVESDLGSAGLSVPTKPKIDSASPRRARTSGPCGPSRGGLGEPLPIWKRLL